MFALCSRLLLQTGIFYGGGVRGGGFANYPKKVYESAMENAIFIGSMVVLAGFSGFFGGLLLHASALRRVHNLAMMVEQLTGDIENLSSRLTTFQKKQASQQGVEARVEAKSLKDEATIRLASENAPKPPEGRPGILTFRRR